MSAPNLLALYLFIVTEGLQLVPDGPSTLARVCISSFCMTCLGAKKKKRKERLAFVMCVTVENEAWRAGVGGSASPLLLLWAGLGYRA